jgi:HEAT repeat protein
MMKRNRLRHCYFILIILLITTPLYRYGNSEDNIQSLIDTLADENILIQQKAVESLVRIGNEAVPYLITSLDSDKRDTKANAIEALGLIGNQSAVPNIITLLKKHSNLNGREGLADQYIRVNSIIALGKLKSKDAIPFLEEILKTERPIDKAWCLTSLYEIDPSDSKFQTIFENAKSNDSSVRNVIIRFLSEQKDPKVLPVLKEALSDKEWFLRDTAANAIGQIGSKEQIEWIKPLLDDPVPLVVETAKKAIESLKK